MTITLFIYKSSCQAPHDCPCAQFSCSCWLPFQLTTATVGTCLCLSISRSLTMWHKDYHFFLIGSLRGAHPGRKQIESRTLRSTSPGSRNILHYHGLQAAVAPILILQANQHTLLVHVFAPSDLRIRSTAHYLHRVRSHRCIKTHVQ